MSDMKKVSFPTIELPTSGANGASGNEAAHASRAAELSAYFVLRQIGTAGAQRIIETGKFTVLNLTIDAKSAASATCHVCHKTHGDESRGKTIGGKGAIVSARSFGLSRLLVSPDGKDVKLVSATCFAERLPNLKPVPRG